MIHRIIKRRRRRREALAAAQDIREWTNGSQPAWQRIDRLANAILAELEKPK